MLIYERSTKAFLYSSIKSVNELKRILNKLNLDSSKGFTYSVLKKELKLEKDQPMLTGHEWFAFGYFSLEAHYKNAKTEVAIIDYIL